MKGCVLFMKRIKNNDLLAKGKEVRNNLVISVLEKNIDCFLFLIISSLISVCHLYKDDEYLQQLYYDDGSEQLFRSQMNILSNSVNCKHFFELLLTETYTNTEFIDLASKFDSEADEEAEYSSFYFLLLALKHICITASKLDPNDTTLSVLMKQKINDYVINPIIVERTRIRTITEFIQHYADYYGIFADEYMELNNKWCKQQVIFNTKTGDVIGYKYVRKE